MEVPIEKLVTVEKLVEVAVERVVEKPKRTCEQCNTVMEFGTIKCAVCPLIKQLNKPQVHSLHITHHATWCLIFQICLLLLSSRWYSEISFTALRFQSASAVQLSWCMKSNTWNGCVVVGSGGGMWNRHRPSALAHARTRMARSNGLPLRAILLP